MKTRGSKIQPQQTPAECCYDRAHEVVCQIEATRINLAWAEAIRSQAATKVGFKQKVKRWLHRFGKKCDTADAIVAYAQHDINCLQFELNGLKQIFSARGLRFDWEVVGGEVMFSQLYQVNPEQRFRFNFDEDFAQRLMR